MFGLSHLFYPWGFLVQIFAIVHFFRRRPEGYWFYVILFLGWPGAAVYVLAEVLPDLSLLRGAFQGFGRRSRIQKVESDILDNPSPANYEELGELYKDQGQYAKGREAFTHAISARGDSIYTFYSRGQCSLAMNDLAAAIPDLQKVVVGDRKFDYYRAAGLLADAYARTGQLERASRCLPKSRRSPRLPRRSTTTQVISRWQTGVKKRANGHRSCWPKSARCRATCSDANGRGSAKARCCSKNSPALEMFAAIQLNDSPTIKEGACFAPNAIEK
jgi:hypothetical protein